MYMSAAHNCLSGDYVDMTDDRITQLLTVLLPRFTTRQRRTACCPTSALTFCGTFRKNLTSDLPSPFNTTIPRILADFNLLSVTFAQHFMFLLLSLQRVLSMLRLVASHASSSGNTECKIGKIGNGKLKLLSYWYVSAICMRI